MSSLKIGLFGFGVVGEGIYNVLQTSDHLHGEVVKVCIKDAQKKRNAPAHLFTTQKQQLLHDSSIDVIIELIDDAESAYHICKDALKAGKSVITANKKMVAYHLCELIELEAKYGGTFLYEAAVCGSIPVIRTLDNCFDSDSIKELHGIVNGSTNYILSQMSQKEESFEDVLRTAQEKGFAESDPTLDIEGFDASFKLSILMLHAQGIIVDHSQIFRKGIESISAFDIAFAKKHGCRIKLIARIQCSDSECFASIIPTFVPDTDQLAHVENELNGIIIQSGLSDAQVLVGKGAGRYPTSFAVLNDLTALAKKHKYSYNKRKAGEYLRFQADQVIQCYLSHHKPIDLPDKAFISISDKYEGKDRSYVQGKIKLSSLKRLLKQHPQLSVIQFS